MPLFSRRGRRPPGGDPPNLGLVVGPRAIQIFDPKTGACIYDELAEREKEYRKTGRPPVIFDDGPDGPFSDANRLK
jgi:hypothetical protein